MTNLNMAATWKRVVKNQNTWVLFKHGTVVIFLPEEVEEIKDLRAEATKRLKEHKVRSVPVAELIGQGLGWIVNCGNDYILNFLSHTEPGNYSSRYDRISAMIEIQKRDQAELKIHHVQM